jgi:hypothetical protein
MFELGDQDDLLQIVSCSGKVRKNPRREIFRGAGEGQGICVFGQYGR